MSSTSAPGEHDLDTLIRSMQPMLHEATFVFATLAPDIAVAEYEPLMQFQEKEGRTLIVEQQRAVQTGLAYEFACRMITLNIHSSLDAVGFLARITRALASHGMSVNPVSGFYHDHLFVPVDRAEEAMTVLFQMTDAVN